MSRRCGCGVSNKALILRVLVLLSLVFGVLGATMLPSRAMAQSRAGHGQSSDGPSTPEAQSPAANKGEEDTDEAYRHSAVVKFLGAKLGMSVDQAATVFEVVNFVVLAALLGVALVRILPKTFRDRTSAIQKRLVEARAATEEASARLNSVEERLNTLDGEIAGMRAQAERDLQAEETRVRAAIEEERVKIAAATEQEIATMSAEARRQIQQYAAELAISQAARKLEVSAETDRLLIEQFAAGLTGGSGRRN